MLFKIVLFIYIHLNYGMIQDLLINATGILTKCYYLILLKNYIYAWDFKF